MPYRGPRPTRSLLAGLGLAAVVLAATACGGGSGGDDAGTVTFWTPHNTPQRMAVQKKLAAAFTARTGIKVEVVGLAAADQNQSMAADAASGKLPDVVLHGVDQTVAWQSQGLLDDDAAQDVMKDLGETTFNAQGRKFAKVGGSYVAVPSDSWGQFLFYRKDLFAKAGLKAPHTFAAAVAAARKLNRGSTAGIVLGTKTGDPFVTQTLEWMALANGCTLTREGTNTPTLTAPNCVHALRAYQDLAKASVKGAQDVESTRAAWLAGRVAMISWSSHLLDENAGLDENFPPTCAQCEKQRDFLAHNTGIVTDLHGPDVATGGEYGLPFNLGIMKHTDTEAAKKFVEYLLSDGYADFLSTAPEGRFPMRNGTAKQPTKYVDEWSALKVGTGAQKRTLSRIYGEEGVRAITTGATHVDRWGFGHGSGPLAASLTSENALAQDAGRLFDGSPPADVAARMQRTTQAAVKDLD